MKRYDYADTLLSVVGIIGWLAVLAVLFTAARAIGQGEGVVGPTLGAIVGILPAVALLAAAEVGKAVLDIAVNTARSERP